MMNTIICEKKDEGSRIDAFLAEETGSSRSFIQKLISDGLIFVNDRQVKANYRISESDKVCYEIPEAVIPDIVPENIPLDIVYEDDDVILINKPKGMVVHPAAGNYSGTMVNALMYHCGDSLSGINGVMRPGIVHRIDKDTTGLIIACKNDIAHNSIAAQLAVHSINRIYDAIVYNKFKEPEGTVDAPIGRHPIDRKKMAINRKNGKEAITHYRVVEDLKGNYSHIKCKLETGRTHQIRVHMSSISHPLLGDTVYGPSKDPFGLTGQALHAGVLGFVHPRTGEYMEFSSPLPDYFTRLLTTI